MLPLLTAVFMFFIGATTKAVWVRVVVVVVVVVVVII